jgi:hypothetical protein
MRKVDHAHHVAVRSGIGQSGGQVVELKQRIRSDALEEGRRRLLKRPLLRWIGLLTLSQQNVASRRLGHTSFYRSQRVLPQGSPQGTAQFFQDRRAFPGGQDERDHLAI